MTVTKATAGFNPDYAVPPGETLEEWLEEHSMRQAELAKRINLSAKTLNQIIRGRAPLTHDTALKLESVTAIPARLWNALEMNYQSGRARVEADRELSEQVEFLERMPVAALRKLGIVTAPNKEKVRVLKEVLAFFGVADPAAWVRVWESPQAAYRQSVAFEAHPGAVAAWLRLGELEALNSRASTFDRVALVHALSELRVLTMQPDPAVFEPEIKRIALAAGVIVVFVPDIPGTRCSGATRWVGNSPVVQLSLRHKSDDHLWFTLFHEMGHVLLHGRNETFIDGGGSRGGSAKEDEANTFAANLLIPEDATTELPSLRSARAIEGFATRIGIAPGIVVGRMQREKLVPFNAYNQLKVKFAFAPDSVT